MGRENTRVMTYINIQFEILGINKQSSYKKTTEILSMYRELRWFTGMRAKDVVDEIFEIGNSDLENSLIVLEIFASAEKRRKMKDNVNSLFYTKRLIDIVDEALVELKHFPRDGEKYYAIIEDNYLSSFMLPQELIAEKHHYERSEYYQKKREAIYLIALKLWK